MKKSHGYRAGTRCLLKKKPRERGKTSIGKLLRGYESGDRVVVKIDSSVHKGMPHKRYHGKVGTVANKRGQSYVININQGNVTKELIVRPEHLKPYASG